eukprot:TRINITY_DN1831_c0_g3_i1.p1 TRINITY_DN1831_c0_g3~~TRINITY_DN1831_c0_g3_i1.p1  ORF type:complete len:546 (+),score=188.68 TRINITY_DN1831_c0_g3_i1:126-1763(+)
MPPSFDEGNVDFKEVLELWRAVQQRFDWEAVEAPERLDGVYLRGDPGDEIGAGGDAEMDEEEQEAPQMTPEQEADCVILRELQKISCDIHDRTSNGGAFDDISYPDESIRADERLTPLLTAMGFGPDPDAPSSLALGVIKKPLLTAVRHFIAAKLGEGHPSFGMQLMMIGAAATDASLLPPEPAAELDLDAIIDRVRRREVPTLDEMRSICYRARALLEKEDNIVLIDPPCTVVGDIHGQFEDLCNHVLASGGDPSSTRYVFLGDFVDRGDSSLLCMCLILLYKLKHPGNVAILRGNHESRITNNLYGFHEECRQKYPDATSTQSSQYNGKLDSLVWGLFNHLFDALPLAALIGGKAFGCHGGLSPHLPTLDKILTFNRFMDILPQGPMADLTWSDPGTQSGWRLNVRGSGHAFGEDVTKDFCEANGLDFVCRAHQCVKDGYRVDQENKMVTIFSAPNYCWAQNKGAIMKLDENMNKEFICYEQAQPSERQMVTPGYFNTGGNNDDDDDDDEGPAEAEDNDGGDAGKSFPDDGIVTDSTGFEDDD